MKKLINRPESLIEEMIEGTVQLYPGLTRITGKPVVTRVDAAEARRTHVALISGGGSGHEPAHAGFVGTGMLSAAVIGGVFTSPPPDAVLAAIQAVGGPSGALLIVKNYTGDRLNFGLAAELARADGMKVETVVVADDVALGSTAQGEHAGRRGLAGTIFVHKIAGAAAEAGLDLMEVAAEARAAAESVFTMGVALSSCVIPAAGKPSFLLGEHEVELGLGIHGEPGIERQPFDSADRLVDRLLDAIILDARLGPSDRVALLVNGLGGTPPMELAVVSRRAIENLENQGIRVERAYAGTFLSAMEMAGFSLSLLRVDATRLARLDAPTAAPAWPNPAAVARPRPRARVRVHVHPSRPELADSETATQPSDAATRYTHQISRPSNLPPTEVETVLARTIQAATQALIESQEHLDTLDRAVGDGDLGTSLARGALALQQIGPTLPLFDPSLAFHAIGLTLQESLGGTSGPLYAVFFLRAGAHLRSDPDRSRIDPIFWAEAFRAGCDGVIELGGAGRGDRTMLDALMPACDAFHDAVAAGAMIADSLSAAADSAEYGRNETRDLVARRGRTSYLGKRALGHPDPGAAAVAIWTRAIAQAFKTPSD